MNLPSPSLWRRGAARTPAARPAGAMREISPDDAAAYPPTPGVVFTLDTAWPAQAKHTRHSPARPVRRTVVPSIRRRMPGHERPSPKPTSPTRARTRADQRFPAFRRRRHRRQRRRQPRTRATAAASPACLCSKWTAPSPASCCCGAAASAASKPALASPLPACCMATRRRLRGWSAPAKPDTARAPPHMKRCSMVPSRLADGPAWRRPHGSSSCAKREQPAFACPWQRPARGRRLPSETHEFHRAHEL